MISDIAFFASYSNVLLTIFEPKNFSEETTGPIWMKLGMNNLFSKTSNIIEAFFDFLPQSRVTGARRG